MLIVCILLGAALAAALFGLFTLKRDIRQMNHTLRDIGDTNALLTTQTANKDISALANSINQMLDCNRRDLLGKAHAEADLKRAITNISHDLRTPLTSALGYLQMLESSELDGETRARYLETVRGRLEALSALMNSLFEFTRVIEGRTSFEIQKVNIANAVRDALSANYAELASLGFAVEADIPEMPVFCLCDRDALRRVLQNLMKNVCVHGKGTVRIRLDGSAIEIANQADGLEVLDTARIFERFYTADASRTSKGTGLGLAISKELVAQMGGEISAGVSGGMLVIRVTLKS